MHTMCRRRRRVWLPPDRHRGLVPDGCDARREDLLPPLVGAEIKTFVDRENMASVGMSGVTSPTADELHAALSTDLQDARYLMSFASRDEAAAFVAALARKLVRDRRVDESAATVWLVGLNAVERESWPVRIFLDEGAMRIAEREFGPLLVGSCIPYLRMPSDRRQLFDARSAEPLGIERANDLLYST